MDTSTGHESARQTTPALTRALRLFGDVSPGETRDVVVMFLNIFTLLVAYYVLKTVREPLILATGGAELKSYAAGAQAAALLLYVPLYGALASRLPVHKLVTWINLAMAACIELFFAAGLARFEFVGFAFYVFIGIFSLTVIAQFWSFANDIYQKEEGDRLFPIIGVGATAGAPIGAAMASLLFSYNISPWAMMQIACGLLLVHTALFRAVHRRSLGPARTRTERSANGFALVLNSPYLRLIGLLLVVLNIVNTTGEYLLSSLVTQRADALALTTAGFDEGAYIGEFYGSFFFWVNILSVALQMFAVSRLVKAFGMAGVLFALPVVALGAYGLMMGGAGLAMVRWMKTAENGSDYSVMNTAKQMLWLPTSREEKYAAKQAIDTFFVRFGDMLAAGVVFLGTTQLALSIRQFATANLMFVCVALVVAWLLLREYRQLTGVPLPSRPEPARARLSAAEAGR
jgi:AAA family ATP:ADP antiporter